MTWFNLPLTQDPPAATGDAAGAVIVDAASASAWLARQPQANVPALQTALLQVLEAMNGWRLPAQQRFEALEALRETLFAVDGECRRRYERKPLPLAEAEQAIFAAAHRLWHAAATGYLHCLRSAVDAAGSSDPERLAQFAASVAHRALVSLRLELTVNLLAGHEASGALWRNLHATLASAEELGICDTPVQDRLLGETRDSTLSGQYAMALLLYLARPWELSRAQFAAASRWFARWRETVATLTQPPSANDDSGAEAPPTRLLALDLALDRALPRRGEIPGIPRWLVLDGVLRKMRQRRRALAAGETPEALKLGSELRSEDCARLLETLSERLKEAARRPPLRNCGDGLNGPGGVSLGVVVGLADIYRWLGGSALAASDDDAMRLQRRQQEQIAIFGHVVRREVAAVSTESWRVAAEEFAAIVPTDAPADADGAAGDAGGRQIRLCRPADAGSGRLLPRQLIAAQLPGASAPQLLRIDSVLARQDASLSLLAHLLPGTPQALLADTRARAGGRTPPEPALLLAAAPARRSAGSLAAEGAAAGAGLAAAADEAHPLASHVADPVAHPVADPVGNLLAILPAGLPARSSSLVLQGSDGARYRLLHCLEHGAGDETWTCTHAG